MQDDRPVDRRQLEFFPFGAVMGQDGTVTMMAGDTGTEHPPSDEVIELLRTAPPTDAICASLEHREGMAVDVVEPYAKRGNKVEYGSLAAQQGRRVVFSSPP